MSFVRHEFEHHLPSELDESPADWYLHRRDHHCWCLRHRRTTSIDRRWWSLEKQSRRDSMAKDSWRSLLWNCLRKSLNDSNSKERSILAEIEQSLANRSTRRLIHFKIYRQANWTKASTGKESLLLKLYLGVVRDRLRTERDRSSEKATTMTTYVLRWINADREDHRQSWHCRWYRSLITVSLSEYQYLS